MASLMCKVILSFVFVWSSIRINASTVKNDFVELPNGVMEITLQYLDIKEYFRVTLQTKQLYRTFYPPLPILVYHHYHQWFTDPQFSIRHPQDLRNLSRYSVFLQSVLLRERSTFKYGMLLQVFTNTLRFERSGDNPNPAADYFSLHRDAFEYGVYRGHEVTIYHSTSVALPVVYDPFTSRLHLYASPSAPDPSQIASTMRLSLPRGLFLPIRIRSVFKRSPSLTGSVPSSAGFGRRISALSGFTALIHFGSCVCSLMRKDFSTKSASVSANIRTQCIVFPFFKRISID